MMKNVKFASKTISYGDDFIATGLEFQDLVDLTRAADEKVEENECTYLRFDGSDEVNCLVITNGDNYVADWDTEMDLLKEGV